MGGQFDGIGEPITDGSIMLEGGVNVEIVYHVDAVRKEEFNGDGGDNASYDDEGAEAVEDGEGGGEDVDEDIAETEIPDDEDQGTEHDPDADDDDDDENHADGDDSDSNVRITRSRARRKSRRGGIRLTMRKRSQTNGRRKRGGDETSLSPDRPILRKRKANVNYYDRYAEDLDKERAADGRGKGSDSMSKPTGALGERHVPKAPYGGGAGRRSFEVRYSDGMLIEVAT